MGLAILTICALYAGLVIIAGVGCFIQWVWNGARDHVVLHYVMSQRAYAAIWHWSGVIFWGGLALGMFVCMIWGLLANSE